MPRFVFSGWALLLGFIIGALIPQEELISHFIAGVLISVLALLVYLIYTSVRHSYLLKHKGFLKSEETFIDIILQLAAGATMVDGKVTSSEKARISAQLEKGFSKTKTEEYLITYESYLEQTIPIEACCKTIRDEFDNATKGHLLYLLISIVTADGILTQGEEDYIDRIVKKARIRSTTVYTVYRLFTFQREQQHDQYQKQSSRPTTSRSSLKSAYELLDLDATCSDKEVKQAFRRLAKIHHPDKLGHLGEVQLKLAKEKFQLIIAAYEQIKTARRIN